jgi:hypothetical protein
LVTLLTIWYIWNERNACVFHNKHAPSLVIFDKIKYEGNFWLSRVLCLKNLVQLFLGWDKAFASLL